MKPGRPKKLRLHDVEGALLTVVERVKAVDAGVLLAIRVAARIFFEMRGDDVPRGMVLESLSDLVAKSIVLADVSGDAVSHRLLETTQAYAYEKLNEAGELEPVRRRHAQRFLEVCRASVVNEDDLAFAEDLRL